MITRNLSYRVDASVKQVSVSHQSCLQGACLGNTGLYISPVLSAGCMPQHSRSLYLTGPVCRGHVLAKQGSVSYWSCLQGVCLSKVGLCISPALSTKCMPQQSRARKCYISLVLCIECMPHTSTSDDQQYTQY